MITVQQAKDALEEIVGYSTECAAEYYLLHEFIRQYEDLTKVKKVILGALLNPPKEKD